jgi:mannose-1-phosphate guanylyltransferase
MRTSAPVHDGLFSPFPSLHSSFEPKSGDIPLKAFLLAAGLGTRLRPLTDNIPKCLVPIRGMPMLEIWLELCRRAGIKDVLINLHAHADTVRSALCGRDGGPQVTVAEEPELLGSAGTLRANRDWVASESCFWVLYADVLTNLNLAKMLSFHQEAGLKVTIGLHQVEDPTRCGVVNFDGDFVVREFVEKPASPSGNWAFSGIMLAGPELLQAIPSSFPTDLGFHVLPQMVGRMQGYPIAEYLLDIGTMENYRSAQETWPGL